MKLLISPFTKPRRDGKPNAKDYPFWTELIDQISKDHDIIQIAVSGERHLVPKVYENEPMRNLVEIAQTVDSWISVDNFFPHFMNYYYPEKRGIVLFGPSDARIFGYNQNINLFPKPPLLRADQFANWEQCEANFAAHIKPMSVVFMLQVMKQFEKQPENQTLI